MLVIHNAVLIFNSILNLKTLQIGTDKQLWCCTPAHLQAISDNVGLVSASQPTCLGSLHSQPLKLQSNAPDQGSNNLKWKEAEQNSLSEDNRSMKQMKIDLFASQVNCQMKLCSRNPFSVARSPVLSFRWKWLYIFRVVHSDCPLLFKASLSLIQCSYPMKDQWPFPYNAD